jgi:hypothetical protein
MTSNVIPIAARQHAPRILASLARRGATLPPQRQSQRARACLTRGEFQRQTKR